MPFLVLTRPDDSEVLANSDHIVQVTPVPPGGGAAGPLPSGSRVHYASGAHQDVKEDVATVRGKLGAV